MKPLIQTGKFKQRLGLLFRRAAAVVAFVLAWAGTQSASAVNEPKASLSFSDRAIKVRESLKQTVPALHQSNPAAHVLQWVNWGNWNNWPNWGNWNNWQNWLNW